LVVFAEIQEVRAATGDDLQHFRGNTRAASGLISGLLYGKAFARREGGKQKRGRDEQLYAHERAQGEESASTAADAP
jgi:hypothetical protein